MTCSRCGSEDSMFWYPYAFGIAPVPSAAVGHCQYFTLCDKCQMEFTDFMLKRGQWFDAEKLKKMMDDTAVFIPEVKE